MLWGYRPAIKKLCHGGVFLYICKYLIVQFCPEARVVCYGRRVDTNAGIFTGVEIAESLCLPGQETKSFNGRLPCKHQRAVAAFPTRKAFIIRNMSTMPAAWDWSRAFAERRATRSSARVLRF